ncbi:Transposase [Fusarium oxysporum f. sp. albedinis]|nr:Transposase [Fusarium oxysporum f. sp. albedinis]
MKYCALNNELPFNVLFELKDEKHKSAKLPLAARPPAGCSGTSGPGTRSKPNIFHRTSLPSVELMAIPPSIR